MPASHHLMIPPCNALKLNSAVYLLAGLIFLTSPACFSNPGEERIYIGHFSQNHLKNWEEKSFLNKSYYNLVTANNTTVLKAQTTAAASGMFREIDIDLTKTPFLNWSWRINNIYQGNNERSKSGDDYPARLYVIVSGGLFFWKTQSVNYVWSSHQTAGTTWDSAYTSNSKMVAVRSGDKETGQWLTEKRNIYTDFKQLFGKEITKINVVAIMSDSDNTKQSATAYYGDIYFSAK